MHDSDSIILSYAAPKTARQNSWLSSEIASAVLLAIEAVVFVGAIVMIGSGLWSGYAGYAPNALMVLATWICLGLEAVALLMSVIGARYRNRATFLVGLHALLFAILGIMSLPTLF